jgi:hypothetical protein
MILGSHRDDHANDCLLGFNACIVIEICPLSALKMEAASSFETSLYSYQIIQRHVQYFGYAISS